MGEQSERNARLYVADSNVALPSDGRERNDRGRALPPPPRTAHTRCVPVPRCMAVTPPVFRRLTLELPEVEECAVPGGREFLIGEHPFAALSRARWAWGLLSLRPEERSVMMRSEPGLYWPVPGTEEDDDSGDTQVKLTAASTMTLAVALHMAWGAQATPELRDRYRGRVAMRSRY